MNLQTLLHGITPCLASAGVNAEAFLHSISGFLGGYYLALAVMNGVMALFLWQKRNDPARALIWVLVAGFFVILSPLAASAYPGMMPQLPQVLRDAVNWATSPTIYTVGTMVVLVVMYVFRRFFVQPMVAWTLLNLSLLAMGLALTDANFAAIVTKADNVPIVSMVYLLGYFTWLAAYQAVLNDDRAKLGQPPLEKLDDEKVLVWPDLVYTELICMIALTAILLVWAIVLKAPLEEPASSVKTPNPSKAPWYFLGLQEMLVYFDRGSPA
jgi:hypothetical protein